MSSTERDAQFESLRDEWERVVVGAEVLQTADRDQRAAQWQARFREVAAEHQTLRERGAWRSGPRDLLSIISRSRRETSHSAILAWLMTPTGHHGFGPAFLQRVMARTSPPTKVTRHAASQAVADCEVHRRRSRADILIRCPVTTIVIETKVDASEGHRQCRRLFDDWEHEGNPTFVFLTFDGREPVTATGPSAQAFRTLSFAAIRDELALLVAEHQAADPRPWGLAAAETYLATLEKELP